MNLFSGDSLKESVGFTVFRCLRAVTPAGSTSGSRMSVIDDELVFSHVLREESVIELVVGHTVRLPLFAPFHATNETRQEHHE